MRLRSRSQKGNAMLEFALSAGVLIPIMAGTFQFGYGMYTYNKLQSAVNDGARYASNRTYRTLLGATDTDKVKLAIKNMVVYGVPSPANGAVPLVNGLGTGDVDVSFATTSGLPTSVTVKLNTFTIDTIFTNYTITGKPVMTFPYVGRYAPEESEP